MQDGHQARVLIQVGDKRLNFRNFGFSLGKIRGTLHAEAEPILHLFAGPLNNMAAP